MRKRLKPVYDRNENGETLDYNGVVFVAGRPPVVLNEEEVERLAREGCPVDAIAGYLGVSYQAVLRNYGEAWFRGKAWVKHQIGKAQLEAALAGNPVMLKHLGKHVLGQDEKIRLEIENHNPALDLPLDALEAEFERIDEEDQE
jgi:hypothetical protein